MKEIDPKIAEAAKRDSEQGMSTGFAHTPETGWVLLVTGQGPFIAWQEKYE